MEKPFVSCKIYGQLGNQLFQIAATLAYSWDYGVDAFFPALDNPHWNISYNKNLLFFRVNAGMPPRAPIHLFSESCWFSPERIPFQKDLLLDGYFQSYRHFHHHKDKILSVFAPSQESTDRLTQKYGSLLQSKNLVGVHVRTQSKRTHDAGIHPFWGMPYYEKALAEFPKDSIFVICSDRINWCKKHFSPLGENFVFIEGNYGIDDLFLLSKCHQLILCNSSFSWWAAYFHKNGDGKVIFPEYWKEEPIHINPKKEDFFLPNWTLLRPPYKPPYPRDLFYCDARSLSVDNQD